MMVDGAKLQIELDMAVTAILRVTEIKTVVLRYF